MRGATPLQHIQLHGHDGRTETVDMDSPADVTEVMANTPVAVALLEVFTSNRGPQGSIAHHSDGHASSRLFADDLADLKSAAADQGLTWQAAPKAKPKE